ncbi:PucR family transcriptional regulator [Nocardioides sp. LHG3406-4]|uniref:PucR family transcriptional regulator n=1 Tax=Nocardioides sp. LHG3406-4 TaxID=2804575 RepID=UPI003CEFBDB7
MTTREGASAALARIDALHSALTELVLEGGDLDRIAAEAARVLGIGVLITSTDGRERASAMTDDLRALLEGGGLVDPTGRFRVERAGADGVPVGGGEARMLRVVAGGTDLARLVGCRADGSITQDDVHALERAAAVAALLITREQAVSAVETKYQGDFLRDLFLGRAGDSAYVTGHLASFGWDLTRPVVVVCAEIDPAPADVAGESAQHRRWQERFAQAWRQVTRDVAEGIPTADFSSEVVALLPALEHDRLGHDVVRRVVKAVAGDKGGGRRPFTVGVSRVTSSLQELPGAYAQSQRALSIGRKLHGSGSTTFFDQLGVHRLFALVPDARELGEFARDVLGPLAEPTAEAAKARETLQVLLDTNFNVAEAAREQFVHYNTLRYRVGKLERQLGPLSSDPHLRLDVAVALRVLEIG